jgi:hypothetical protein
MLTKSVLNAIPSVAFFKWPLKSDSSSVQFGRSTTPEDAFGMRTQPVFQEQDLALLRQYVAYQLGLPVNSPASVIQARYLDHIVLANVKARRSQLRGQSFERSQGHVQAFYKKLCVRLFMPNFKSTSSERFYRALKNTLHCPPDQLMAKVLEVKELQELLEPQQVGHSATRLGILKVSEPLTTYDLYQLLAEKNERELTRIIRQNKHLSLQSPDQQKQSASLDELA